MRSIQRGAPPDRHRPVGRLVPVQRDRERGHHVAQRGGRRRHVAVVAVRVGDLRAARAHGLPAQAFARLAAEAREVPARAVRCDGHEPGGGVAEVDVDDVGAHRARDLRHSASSTCSRSSDAPSDRAARASAAWPAALRARSAASQKRSSACPADSVTARSSAISGGSNGWSYRRPTPTTARPPVSAAKDSTASQRRPMPSASIPSSPSGGSPRRPAITSGSCSSASPCSPIRPLEPTELGRRALGALDDEEGDLGLERLAQLPRDRLADRGLRERGVDHRQDLRPARRLDEAAQHLVALVVLAVGSLKRRPRPRPHGCDPLRSSQAADLASRVDPRHRRRLAVGGLGQAVEHAGGLRLQARAEHVLAPGAVEHERGTRRPAAELRARGARGVRRAEDDRLDRLRADVDRRVDRDARRADEAALAVAVEHVAKPNVAAELRLRERVRGGERAELAVAQAPSLDAELAQVDGLGRAPVELADHDALGRGDDGGRHGRGAAAVRGAEADRRVGPSATATTDRSYARPCSSCAGGSPAAPPPASGTMPPATA